MAIIINLPERLGPKIQEILKVESNKSREDLFEKLIDKKSKN